MEFERLNRLSSARHVLLAILTQLFILFILSGIWTLPADFFASTGITRASFTIYIAVIVITLSLITYAIGLTRPLYIQHIFLVVFAWAAIISLFPNSCICCTGGGIGEDSGFCKSYGFAALYSSLWLLVALASYLVESSSVILRTISKGILIVLVLPLSLAPGQCTQLSTTSLVLLIIRLTLALTIWIGTWTGRTYEDALFTIYRNLVLEPTIRKRGSPPPSVLQQLTPSELFTIADQQLRVSTRQRVDLRSFFAPRTGVFAFASTRLSWKERDYSIVLRHVLDAIRVLWILFVCPWFLFAASLPFVWMFVVVGATTTEINIYTRENSAPGRKALQELIEKSAATLSTDPASVLYQHLDPSGIYINLRDL